MADEDPRLRGLLDRPRRRAPESERTALERDKRIDARGRPVRYYETTSSSGDDYAHAEVFALVATELWRATVGAQQLAAMYGEAVPDDSSASSACGWR